MEASACSACITLSPVHEAKEPKSSPQKRVDGATTDERRGSTRIDGATHHPKGAASKLKKRTLFQEEETIRVIVKADDRVEG